MFLSPPLPVEIYTLRTQKTMKDSRSDKLDDFILNLDKNFMEGLQS